MSFGIGAGSLAYDDAGSSAPGAPTFVFVHGLGCSREFWQPQFDDLSRDHRCISVDMRGCGESSATPPFHTRQQADDVAALIRALDAAPASIVGHSLGGIVALLANDRHEELVCGIVIGDSPVLPEVFGIEGLIAALREASTTEPLRPLVDSFWSEGTSPEVKELAVRVMLGTPTEVLAGMVESFPTERMGELVKLADKKPFMAIWAERPAGDPAWLRKVTMFLRQEPIAGTGHFFQLEEPAVTTALLRAFLDDVERDPRIAH